MPSIVLPLTGNGFRLTVGDDGKVHNWVDLVMPPGDYLVSLATAGGQVSSVHLLGPASSGDLLDARTIVDIAEGSVFCLSDFRHRQPELGPFLAHETIASELGETLARVVTPDWLGTPVLLVGPTTDAYYNLWSLAWCKGGGAASTVSLTAMDD